MSCIHITLFCTAIILRAFFLKEICLSPLLTTLLFRAFFTVFLALFRDCFHNVHKPHLRIGDGTQKKPRMHTKILSLHRTCLVNRSVEILCPGGVTFFLVQHKILRDIDNGTVSIIPIRGKTANHALYFPY